MYNSCINIYIYILKIYFNIDYYGKEKFNVIYHLKMRTNVVVLFIFIIRNIRINIFIVLDLFYVCIMNLKK